MDIKKIVGRTFDSVGVYPSLLLPFTVPAIIAIFSDVAGYRITTSISLIQSLWSFSPVQVYKYYYDMSKMYGTFFYIFPSFGIGLFISLLNGLITILAAATTIFMTYRFVRGKKISVSEGFDKATKKLLLLLFVAFIAFVIVKILELIGIMVFVVGAVVTYFLAKIFLAFVYQGVLIDRLNLGETFSNSFNLAKKNIFDVFVIVLIFLVAELVVSTIPILGSGLIYLVRGTEFVALTILYLDRK